MRLEPPPAAPEIGSFFKGAAKPAPPRREEPPSAAPEAPPDPVGSFYRAPGPAPGLSVARMTVTYERPKGAKPASGGIFGALPGPHHYG